MEHSTDGVNATPILQKFTCGVGHVINDVFRGMAFSYTLVFMLKVAELTGTQAGLIMLICQLTDSFTGPLIGYCSDKLSLPLLAPCVGRRKAWHLLGTIVMAIFFSLFFTRCLICTESSSGLKFAYYAVIVAILCMAFPAVDIGHLAIIAAVAKTQDECVTLNALRTMFTYVSGICAYGVTWAILGSESEEGLTPDSWKDFTMINVILAGTGLLFSGIIFQVGTREPKEIKPTTKVDEAFTKTGLVSVGMIFTLGTNLEESADSSKRRVSFPLRKISSFLASYDQTAEELPHHTENGERKSSKERKTSHKRGPSRRTSRLRKISAFLVPFETGYESEYPEEDGGPSGTEEIKEDFNRETHRKESAERRKSSVFIGMGKGMMTSFIEDPNIRKSSIEPRRALTSISEAYTNEAIENEGQDNRTLPEADERMEEGRRKLSPDNGLAVNAKKKSSLPSKIVDACHIAEEAKERIPKTRKQWLKDPMLYMTGAIYTLTRLMQDAGYSYMSFYLTDYLKLPTAAIAYFPLILLVSATVGTAVGKVLNLKVGSKWTYCMAASLATGSAVGFFLITPATHSAVAYVLTIIMGAGMACTFVMALSFMTALIGENKETAGFVFSLASFMAKMTSGGFFIGVQSFYPSSAEKVGTFARYVFSLSLGILAILGSIIVLISQRSTRPVGNENRSARGTAVQERFSVVQSQLSIEPERDTACDTRL